MLTPDTRPTAHAAAPIPIASGTVVTMNDAREAVPADVLVGTDGAIAALLPPGSPVPAVTRLVDATGCFVVPGLIQAHLHLCQTLFRGFAEERPRGLAFPER